MTSRTRTRYVIAAIFVPLLLLAWPASSPAATARVESFSKTLFFFAAPGETNVVTVGNPGANFIVTDIGAPLTPGTGCIAVSANQVSCASADVDEIEIRLGDLNDSASIGENVTAVNSDPFDPEVVIQGDAGADELTGGPNARNELFGGAQFSFPPDPAANTLTGGALRDRLSGAEGNDTLNAGAGDDELFGAEGNDNMSGGNGSDSFRSSSSPDGADRIRGGLDTDSVGYDRSGGVTVSLNDVADDGEGCPGAGCERDDVGSDVESLSTGDGADVVVGSAAPNGIFTGDGADRVDGGAGADRIFSGSGEDALGGGPGDDTIIGFKDPDVLRGGPGADTLVSSESDDDPDQLFGGGGIDAADYSGANDRVKVSLDNRPNDGVAGENDNVHADVEDVFGSSGPDILIGSRAANQLEGGRGRDKLRGLGGLDGLYGGRGADLLAGGGATDVLDAGAGPDRLLARGGGADEVSCGSSLDRGTADRRDRLGGDCERVVRR